MQERLSIPYPIIVEGKYDRLRLLSVCDATILTTDGFGIFKKQEKLTLLRKLSEKTPLIVLTDSDGAGKVIRSHLTSGVPADRLIQLYSPQIAGKENRKAQASAEGTLGVEGMERELLWNLLAPYESEETLHRAENNPLSKVDFWTFFLLYFFHFYDILDLQKGVVHMVPSMFMQSSVRCSLRISGCIRK